MTDTATQPTTQEVEDDIVFDFSNQTDIFDPSQHAWPVTVIGLGGIGSMLVLKLAKLGVTRLRLWDDDLVELHNLPYQMYRPRDIGRSKAEATADILRDFGYTDVEAHAERISADTPLEGLVIAGVDSMTSRQAIWEAVQWNVNVPLYMDGRLGGEHVQLFTINPSDPEDVERYEKTLFTDEEAAPLPCAARAVIHPAMDVTMMMVAQITNFTREDRPLPWTITKFTPDFEAFAF